MALQSVSQDQGGITMVEIANSSRNLYPNWSLPNAGFVVSVLVDVKTSIRISSHLKGGYSTLMEYNSEYLLEPIFTSIGVA